MRLLRSPELRAQFIIQISAAVIGFAGCLFISVPAAFILLSVTGISITLQLIAQSVREQKLAHLCDEIDKILHGAEKVEFDEFTEGELSVLASEIHKMTIRLREQNSALKEDRRFLKETLEDMSHQLNTPLTTMLLILGMMREPELPRRQRMEYVRELCELLSRMQWMLETLLKLSRLDAGAVTFLTEELRVSELIRSAVDPLSISIELKGLTVHTEIEGDPILYGDRRYLTEALVNILKNCLEHTPSGGEINIRAFENSLYTEVTVTDSGNGIPEQDLPHIFERFYRGSEFFKNGYGIGLAFARKLVTSQNGSLRAMNNDPRGAKFELRIYKTAT